MANDPEKSGIPGWLRVVLVIVVLCGVVGTTLVLVGGAFVMNLGREAQDPDHIKKVATTFMKMREPLPAGFKYKMGMNILGNKVVALQTEDKHLLVTFVDLKESKSIEDPEQAINRLSVASGSSKGHVKFEVKKKGTEIVGGRKLTYAIGSSYDSSTGKRIESFIGMFPANADRNVCVYGLNQGDSPEYDLPATEKLLQDIDLI